MGGLANRKNALGNKVIEEVGVEAYDGSVKLIRQLGQQGFKIALVASSQNCEAVLKATKPDADFDVQVDGNEIEAKQLAGKPAPDTFLMAAKLLGVEPTRAVVIRTQSPVLSYNNLTPWASLFSEARTAWTISPAIALIAVWCQIRST